MLIAFKDIVEYWIHEIMNGNSNKFQFNVIIRSLCGQKTIFSLSADQQAGVILDHFNCLGIIQTKQSQSQKSSNIRQIYSSRRNHRAQWCSNKFLELLSKPRKTADSYILILFMRRNVKCNTYYANFLSLRRYSKNYSNDE